MREGRRSEASGAASAAGISSPAAPIQPIRSPAVTTAPASWTIRTRTPDQAASTSSVALSVSTSSSGSPSLTSSPTCFSQAAIRISSLVCPSGGMRTLFHEVTSARTVAAIRSSEGRTASSSTGAAGAGTSKLATRLIGPSSASRHSSATRAATSAPQPPVSVSSWTITRRPVRLTEAKIVSLSSGLSVSGSITSHSMPSAASCSAAASER